jgi:hypothetical protein
MIMNMLINQLTINSRQPRPYYELGRRESVYFPELTTEFNIKFIISDQMTKGEMIITDSEFIKEGIRRLTDFGIEALHHYVKKNASRVGLITHIELNNGSSITSIKGRVIQ